MKIGIIIPDRGDRPKLTENCFRMMTMQSLRPDYIAYMDNKPKDEMPDLCFRYKHGYAKMPDVDLIFFIENDDWYHEDYIAYMVEEWYNAGKPDIFGIDYTYYYHLPTKRYFKYGHEGRASMMNTCIKPNLCIKWPADHFRFVDMELWRQLKGETIAPEKIYSVGMKGHGEGMHGGTGHNSKLFRYTEEDNGFLKATLDQVSFDFYSNYVD